MTDISHLYRRFYKPLRKWLDRRCAFNGVDPDDVAQEVFMRLLKYPHMQGNAHDGYIFRIASNVANNYREMAVNRHPHAPVELLILEGLDELQIDDRMTPEAVVARESTGAFVRRTVASMPFRARQCFLLHIERELTQKQIAAYLGITQCQVVHDLEDAYELLRKRLP